MPATTFHWIRVQTFCYATERKELLEEVMEATGASAPQALELLCVMERSPSDGLTLLARCTRRDRLS